MIFTYTQMDAHGTRVMHALSIPTYAVLILGAWTLPYGKPLLGLLFAALGVLAYQYLYCKLLILMARRNEPRRHNWHFLFSVVLFQFLVVSLACVYAWA